MRMDLVCKRCGPLLAVTLLVVGGSGVASAQGGDQDAAKDGATAKQDPTLDDLQSRIEELESRFGKTPTTGGPAATMKVFGRIHLDGWTFPGSDSDINVFENGDPNNNPDSVVEFRRARLGVSGKIQTDMNYKVEIDFAKPDSLVFKDLYFGFTDVPVAQTILIGNQKRPYGLDHLNSSRYNVFMERPFIVESLNQDARRMGIAAYGVDKDMTWNWRYGGYLLQDWSGSGEIVGDQIQPELAARLARTAWYEDDGRDYGHFAVSGAVAWPDDDQAGSRFRTRPEARSQSRWINTGMISDAEMYGLGGLEAVGNFGRTQATAEVMGTQVDRDNGMDNPTFWGTYVYLAYFLTDDYMPWDRSSGTLARIKPSEPFRKAGGWGAWQVAARYSFADFTDEDINGGEGNSLTLGLNWYWNSHASVQFNYIHGRISDRSVAASPPDGDLYGSGNYDILGIRFRVDF